MVARRGRGIGARLRLAFARFAVALVAIAILFGASRAGSAYVYCPAMGEVSDRPCCATDEHDRDDVSIVAIRARDCCERHVLGQLPPGGANAEPPRIAHAPVLAALPAPVFSVDLRSASYAVEAGHNVRAGPLVRRHHRADTRVYLI